MQKMNLLYGMAAEAAFFVFFYYLLYLLNVAGNLWMHSFILWALMNVAVIFCPAVRKCCK